VFFSRAERGFAELLTLIGVGDVEGAHTAWQATLLDAARLAWAAAGEMLGPSAAALRARALTEGAFFALIEPLRPATASASVPPQPLEEVPP
jgi:hypothetical protein